MIELLKKMRPSVLISLLVSVAVAIMIASCQDETPKDAFGSWPSNNKDQAPGKYPQTDAGEILDQADRITDVLWDTTFTVTPGLEYYQFILETYDGKKQDTYLLKADLSRGLRLKVGVSKQTAPPIWHEEILSVMMADMSSLLKPVYAMVNGDFCNNVVVPIRPIGPVHSDGKVLAEDYCPDPDQEHQGVSYLAVTNSGKMKIGPTNEFESVKDTLKECTGGGIILVQDHKIQQTGSVQYNTSRDPRTAIGYTSDDIVWVFAVDGRHKGTEGMTYMEMACIFKALGCQAAVNLDGGGSTEMLIRHPQTSEIVVCNWPSDSAFDKGNAEGDGGFERPRPTTWAIVKK